MLRNRAAFFSLLFLSFVLSGQTNKQEKEMESSKEEEQYEATRKLLDSGRFEFRAEWARPFHGGRINLVNNPNYLRVDRDSASMHLPYFGVAHTSSNAFSSVGGIVFEGNCKNYMLRTNDKRREIKITFRCRAQSEMLDFHLTVYASGNSRLNANSSIRTSVKYDGKIFATDSGNKSTEN